MTRLRLVSWQEITPREEDAGAYAAIRALSPRKAAGSAQVEKTFSRKALALAALAHFTAFAILLAAPMSETKVEKEPSAPMLVSLIAAPQPVIAPKPEIVPPEPPKPEPQPVVQQKPKPKPKVEPVPKPVVEPTPQPQMEETTVISAAFILSAMIAAGGTANWLLFRRARAATRFVALQQLPEPEARVMLGRLGGVHRGPTILLVVLALAVAISQFFGQQPA